MELDDAGELVGVERCAADQGAVDLGHGHELGDVARLHAAAVLDAHRVGGVGAAEARATSPRITPIVVVGVVGRRVAAGADRPDRLVGDDARAPPRRPSRPANAGLDLAGRPSRRSRPPRAPRASRRRTGSASCPCRSTALQLLVHRSRRSRRTARGARSGRRSRSCTLQLGEHRRAHLAGERALVLPVAVLRAEADLRAGRRRSSSAPSGGR